MSPNQEIDNFLHPRSPYHGKVKPENLVFNANLQEFAQKVSYICNLETAGKIDTKDAYKKIKALWKALKASKKELGIGTDPMNPDNAADVDVDGFNIEPDESDNDPGESDISDIKSDNSE
jgi:hypothetical protein